MNKQFLQSVGLGFLNESDFKSKSIKLRDGRNAILWVHKPSGHGLLDKEYWPEEILGDYYSKDYRDQHSLSLIHI